MKTEGNKEKHNDIPSTVRIYPVSVNTKKKLSNMRKRYLQSLKHNMVDTSVSQKRIKRTIQKQATLKNRTLICSHPTELCKPKKKKGDTNTMQHSQTR